MNWIEIDKILYSIISRHDNVDDIYNEAEKQFKWSKSQAKVAVDPLLKRIDWKSNGGICNKDSNSRTKKTSGRRQVRNKSKTARK